jgi:hypothetical protein
LVVFFLQLAGILFIVAAAIALSMISFCQRLFPLGMGMEFTTLYPSSPVGINFRRINIGQYGRMENYEHFTR